MKYIVADTIFGAYYELIFRLRQEGIETSSTYEFENCVLEIHNPNTNDVFFPFRKVSSKYINAELKWYWSGDNSVETISKYAKMWASLTDDGKTNNSAYGYIIEKKYQKDQIQAVIDILSTDKESRRAIINISDPFLDKKTTKDLQCTIALQFLIRNDELHMTVYMRSNDVYFGLPYDYIYFVSIGEYVASKLNVHFGLYTHNATSMHMYKKDVEKFIPHSEFPEFDAKSIIKENYDETYN